jgi:hypothetical protein
MTVDNIETRRYYARLYWNWPVEMIMLHLKEIDHFVEVSKSDDMIEVRKLMDEKIEIWK